MKRAWGVGIVIAAAGLCGAPADVSAQAETEMDGSAFMLHLAGDRGWRVECALTKDDGRQSKPSARGRGGSSTGSIVAFDVTEGKCDIAAGNRGTLRVTLDERSAAFKCPFGEPEEGALCQRAFPADAKVSIDVTLK